METIKHAGCTIEIWQDSDCESPREWDNLGVMVLFHSRYSLANELDLRQKDYNGWGELVDAIREREGAIVWKAVHMYDHSGIALSTEYTYPFNCPWDAGRVGLIFVTHKRIAEEYGEVTPATTLQAAKVLTAEVEEYSQWLNGDCWGYGITHSGGRDTCSGFIGYDTCLEAAKHEAEYWATVTAPV